MAKKKAAQKPPKEHVGWIEHPEQELTNLYKQLDALYAKIHETAQRIMPVGTCVYWAFGNGVPRRTSIKAHDAHPYLREPVFEVNVGHSRKFANVRALAVDNEREVWRARRIMAAKEAERQAKAKKKAVKKKRAAG